MAYYFVIKNWFGRDRCFKTQTPPRTKPDPSQIGIELTRFVLTEEQWGWSLNELRQAAEFGTLEHYRT